jgi:hypothetical protein
MASVKDLLKTSVSSFKAPPRLPAANYVVVITGYDLNEFHWQKSNTSGMSYVPTIRLVSCVEADDTDGNPELAAEIQKELDKFGDWASKTYCFNYKNKETGKVMAGIAEINYPLLECDDDGDVIGILDKHAWRFYLREDDGTEKGFVHDVLGLSFPENTPLGDVLEATIGKKFMASFAYEPNSKDPSRPPNLVIESITSA